MACVGLGATLPATAGADDGAPPYSEGGIPDAIEICRGNPYDIVERDGDLYVRCDGGTLTDDWRVFTTSATLSGTAATITIARAHGRGPALVSYATQPGTATAGVDYLTTSGRLYFAEGETVRTATVPLATIAPPPGTPARSFTVGFGDVANLGLTVPPATVELPAVAPSPDPGYPLGPPYGHNHDPYVDCLGSPFDTVLHNGDRYTVCYGGGAGELAWQRFSATSDVEGDTATVVVTRESGHAPAVLGLAMTDGTAIAGRDYVQRTGEVYFAPGVTSRSVEVPVVRHTDAASDRTFTVVLSDLLGAGLSVSSATVTIPGGPPTATTRPAIDGVARVAQQLTASDGDWTHEPTGYARAWERCDASGANCQPIGGASGTTYELTAADAGSRLRVAVAATNDYGTTTERSLPTAVVRPALAPPTITAGPTGSQVIRRADLGFTGESGATFECRLDDAAFAACTSPRTLTQLPVGERRFEVRQRATDGVVSVAAARDWTVLPSPDPGFPDGPPYAPTRHPDGDYACNGGFYSIPTRNGDRYVRCLGAVAFYDWQRFSPTVEVGTTLATITLARTEMAAPALIGFATEAGTAEAGRDFTAIEGELYFRDTVLSRTLTVPIVRDPQASSDRSFTVRLTDTVNAGLGLPSVTVTIPGNPPTVTAAPTLGGIARVGERLTATDGAWTHEPTGYTYVWERCDAAGTGCAPIEDATEADYAPVAEDVGSRLRVAVTATNGSGSTIARSTLTAAVRAALPAPTLQSGPTGEQILHRALFGFTGESGATFECRLDDAAFAACTSPRTLTQLPAGEHRFEVRQRATDGAVSEPAVREWMVLPSPDPGYPLAPPYGHGVDAFSECVGGAFELRSHNGDRYSVCLGQRGAHAWQRFSATVEVTGETATVTVTREGGAAPTLLRFATADGTAIAGDDYQARGGELYFARDATARTIEIPLVRDPDATSDRTFSVRLEDFLDLNLQVEGTTVTIPGNVPAATASPEIDGVARVGYELTATDGAWTHEPTGYAHAWERCDPDGGDCAPIADASGATYEPVAADAGARLRVAVSASNGSGTTVERSAPSAVVRPVLGAPTVTGGPTGETQATSATFTLAGEAGATFECRRDDGTFVPCPSPVTYDGLGLGAHELAVRQVADDGAVSGEAIRRWTVVAPDPGPGGGGDGGGGDHPPGPGGGGGEHPPGPGGGGGEHPPGPGDQPPGGDVLLPGPGATPKTPVRMTTVRLELRFCAGCTRPSAADRRRLQRLRARVAGSRLLAIDGYGDRGRSRSDNRRLARSRARAVERVLLSGLKRRPARRAIVAHDRLVRAPTKAAADVRRGGRPAERIVTVRVVNRR